MDPPLRFDGSGGTMSLQVDLSNLPVMTNGKNPKSFKQLFHLIYLLRCPSIDCKLYTPYSSSKLLSCKYNTRNSTNKSKNYN